MSRSVSRRGGISADRVKRGSRGNSIPAFYHKTSRSISAFFFCGALGARQDDRKFDFQRATDAQQGVERRVSLFMLNETNHALGKT